MSEAPSHASAGSHNSLRPDDSISQIVPQYFTDHTSYRYDMDLDDDGSTPSDILSSAPSDLLTATIDSHISHSEPSSSRHTIQSDNRPHLSSFTNTLPGPQITIPSSFLPRKKARKGHCWLPENGIEVLDNGKWRWKCARCP